MLTKPRTYPLNQSPLFKLIKRKKLARLLGLSEAELRRLSKYSDSLYSERDIPKKKGEGQRHIEDPNHKLKRAQAALARVLIRITPPGYLFCPVKKRCYVSNAAQHCGNRVVRCLDIRRYFPNTPSRRVFWFFHKVMKCDRSIAGVLTQLACYRGHLPTGSPLSPIMAYFAYCDVWDAVAEICNQHRYVLTVYIDDVTISGATVSAKVMWEIKSAIHRAGMRYHKEKVYVDVPAEITGVIVKGQQLIAPNRQLKKLKDAKFALKTEPSGIASRALQDQIVGLRGQLSQIRART